jgi:hypothetical protein
MLSISEALVYFKTKLVSIVVMLFSVKKNYFAVSDISPGPYVAILNYYVL